MLAPRSTNPDAVRPDRPPRRVLVALAVPFLRRGVGETIEDADDFTVVGTVATPEEVMPAVRQLRPDIAVIDADFQRSNPELLPEISRAHEGCAVLVLVNHSDEECVIRSMLSAPDAPKLSPDAVAHLQECCLLALRASARGCVPKMAEPERLLSAIRTVAAGEVAAGAWLDALLLHAGGRPTFSGDGPGRISGRELEVITLVARGLANKEIAEQLGIREQTVKNHLSRVMRKLGLRNRQEVAVYAVKRHLIPSE